MPYPLTFWICLRLRAPPATRRTLISVVINLHRISLTLLSRWNYNHLNSVLPKKAHFTCGSSAFAPSVDVLLSSLLLFSESIGIICRKILDNTTPSSLTADAESWELWAASAWLGPEAECGSSLLSLTIWPPGNMLLSSCSSPLTWAENPCSLSASEGELLLPEKVSVI